MAGVLGPGSQLTEAALAEQLGISRGPVREAFQRLTQEGLAINHRNRGVFVATLNEDDIEDIYFARGAVESAAAVRLLAVENSGVADSLGSIVEQMERHASAGRWSDVVHQDLRFHETLVHFSGSKRLERMFSTLLSETQMCLHAAGPAYKSYLPIADEHRSLLNAIEASDLELTLQLLSDHMRHSSELLMNHLRHDVDNKREAGA